MNKTIKTITIFFTALLILGATLKTNAQSLNLAGDWKVDTARTNYGAPGRVSTPVELKIRQTADTLSIERIAINHLGRSHSYTERLSYNGTPVVNMNQTTKKTASIKWSQKALIETAAYRDDHFDKTYKASETWTLSADGKTLTIDRIDDGDDGHDVSKMVYNKQQ